MENCFVAVLSVTIECREQQSLLEPVPPLQTYDRYLFWFCMKGHINKPE